MERDVGERFVAALGERDWAALESLLAPEVRFRALVPAALREESGPAATVGRFRVWFDDSSEFRLDGSSVGTVAEQLRLSWRVHGVEDGAPYVVEQQAYATVEDGQISDLALVCSGFQDRETVRL